MPSSQEPVFTAAFPGRSIGDDVKTGGAMVRWFLVLGAVLALPAATVVAAPLGALQIVRLSAELFAEGIARDDAVLMLAAARLRKPVEITLSDRTPGAVMASVHVPLGWQEMADQAAALAEDDDALLGLIDDLRAETPRARPRGRSTTLPHFFPARATTILPRPSAAAPWPKPMSRPRRRPI